MKKIIFTLLLIWLSCNLQAQVDPLFFQQTQHRSLINPASTAKGGNIDAALLVRQQWVGFPGLSTNAVYAQGFLDYFQSGIGIKFIMDEYGPQETKNVKVNYAFFAALTDDAILSLGVAAGIMNNVFKGSDRYFVAHDPGDPSIPFETRTKTMADFDFGVEFNTRQFELGAASTHITYGRFDQMILRPMRNYYAYTRVKALLNRHWDLIPGATWQFNRWQSTYELNMGLRHNNNFTFNIAYRNPMSLGMAVGMTLYEGFRLSYSYDYGLDNLNAYNSGSHEVVISYHIPVNVSFIGTKIRFFRWKMF